MSLVLLPIRLVSFWYPQALIFFARTWHNLMFFLEEDLAVGLMLRLLFVPLFHDSSIVGHLVSFLFRLIRISIGILAFIAVTILIALLAIVWFLTPVMLLVIPILNLPVELYFLDVLLVLFGLALFVNYLLHMPLKKVWQIKSGKDIWSGTKLKKNDINWDFLIKTPEVIALLGDLEITPSHFGQLKIEVTDEYLNQVLSLAKKIPNARFITPEYFWLTAFLNVLGIENELLKVDLKPSDFEGALAFIELKRNKWRKVFIWDSDFSVRHLKGVNRGWLSAPTPYLDRVSTDLTKEASNKGFPEFIGRENIFTQVVSVLSQDKDRNVLLVGSPGSGRSALVNALAAKIISGDAPPALATKRLVSLDITKLLSLGSTEGDLALAIKQVFEEISFVQDIIVYVDELQNLGVGDAGNNFNLYSLMLSYLESDRFQFLASTDSASYAKIIEKNGSFARIFNRIDLSPATPEESIEIIENKAIDVARYQKIMTTFIAIQEIVHYSTKYIHNRVLPDSALSIFTQAEVSAVDKKITSQVIKSVVSQEVNIPVMEVENNQSETLLNLEKIIHERMIDQEEAVSVVANTLRRGAASLREENRPIGSFLFVGPTGVGKTELAKTLADVYFKNSGAFVRFDMSEYQTTDSIGRLIGTENTPGELTEIIKNKPYCLLLLDEFEKASPQILNLFLQVLDDGRLTSSSGETVDFTNTIIIATSNASSLTIAQDIKAGKSFSEVEKQVREELLKVFKPELVNRFDDIVVFKPLSSSDLQQIVTKKLESLQKMLKDQGYLIDFDTDVTRMLSEKGFDPVLGARPLRRLIQDTIEARLSVLILEKKLPKGESFTVTKEILN